MISALCAGPLGPGAPDLAADLAAAGIHVLGAVQCDKLVHEVVRLPPDVLVCWSPYPDDAFFEALRLVQSLQPVPVLVFTHDAQAETVERALAAGVDEWVVNGYAAARLRPLVQLAQARHRHARRQREALHDLQLRFDERKLVERAKGLMMRRQAISEEEAFRRLRGAAMHGKQRVGQVSQQLIHATLDAEAVNRAGQLRMLSQRIVKLHALEAAGVDPAEARAGLAQSVAMLRANLDHLARTLSKETFGDLLDAVNSSWNALQPRVGARAAPAQLAAVDGAAEGLLEAADRLTAALEAASPLPTVTVINLSGRQRMLSQRAAKCALLGSLLEGEPAQAARAGAAEAQRQFAAALQQLGELPLSTAAIRIELVAAQRDGEALGRAAQAAGTAAARREIAALSEALLARFEALTERYELELQRLLA